MSRRILYVHGIAEIGGAERDLFTLLKTIDHERWDIHVACPAGPFYDLMKSVGIAAYPLPLPAWRKWFSPFVRGAAVARLRALITTLQPALIHVNDMWWLPHTIRAARHRVLARIPIVVHVRQEIEPNKAKRYRIDKADAVISISRHVSAALVAGGVPVDRVQTIYSGIDTSAPAEPSGHDRETICRGLGLPGTVVLFGTVANVFPRKGYEVMLRSLPPILQSVPNAHYVIIGTDQTDYARDLRGLIQQLGIVDHVHFVGFQDPVNHYLSALDLYVHPALMEGFGIAVVEAMAAGKAVVATTVGGLPEVVVDGETGLLVPPDNGDELARAVIGLLQDRPRCQQMGLRGVARVAQYFNAKSAATAIEQIYGDVLAQNSRSPQAGMCL